MPKKAFILSFLLIFILWDVAYAQIKKTTSYYFDTDSSVLDENQYAIFRQFINELDFAEIMSISIYGYCDDRGRVSYNDSLSIKRANYVKALLKQVKVNPNKVSLLVGNGEVQLNETENVKIQRSNNRRVDLVITYEKKNFKSDNSILSDTLKIGDKIVLDNILFENSKSILLEESIPVLEKITALVKEKRQYSFVILGHICCNPPGRDVKDFATGEFNLSQARAKMIYDYLIYKGVHPTRLSYKGMMANYPLGKGEKADRRVEFQITGIKTSSP